MFQEMKTWWVRRRIDFFLARSTNSLPLRVSSCGLVPGVSFSRRHYSRHHHRPWYLRTLGCVWAHILFRRDLSWRIITTDVAAARVLWVLVWMLWLVWWCPGDSSPPTAQSSLILRPISPQSRPGAEGGYCCGGWLLVLLSASLSSDPVAVRVSLRSYWWRGYCSYLSWEIFCSSGSW